MEGFGGLIVLGGPMHAGDDEGYPAFASILSLIRECKQARVPVLGLCLGAQLIARAFGQRVYRFGGLGVGYPTVHLTAAGRADPLFQGLEPEQRIMQMHEDSFDLPGEPVLLMRNDACKNQAFRIGTSIYGIQAHPEVTRERHPEISTRLLGCHDAALRRPRGSRRTEGSFGGRHIL